MVASTMGKTMSQNRDGLLRRFVLSVMTNVDHTIASLRRTHDACGMRRRQSRNALPVSMLRKRLSRSTDQLRESTRSAQLRVADMAEKRAQSVRMATLGERSRIARDIHDNVGYLLTRAIMQSQAGRAVAEVTGDTVAVGSIGALASTLDDAMTMIRKSIHDLEDEGTDFATQIEDAALSFTMSGDAGTKLVVGLENNMTWVPAPVARCLATVIRESLANVVHHSEAHEAQVTLRDSPAFWQLVVSDPGPALLSDARGNAPHGMGIADIESRVRALGGTASCGPYDGGWRVFASIPKDRWIAQTPSENLRHVAKPLISGITCNAGTHGKADAA